MRASRARARRSARSRPRPRTPSTPEALWPPHPLDEEDARAARSARLRRLCLGCGRASIWALHAGSQRGARRRARDASCAGGRGEPARALPRARPTSPTTAVVAGAPPRRGGHPRSSPTRWRRARRPGGVRCSTSSAPTSRNPALELLWGVAGDDARRPQVLHQRTGDRRSWAGGVARLGRSPSGPRGTATSGARTSVGEPSCTSSAPAHGFAGNVYVARPAGGLPAAGPAAQSSSSRAVDVRSQRHARRAERPPPVARAQLEWPPSGTGRPRSSGRSAVPRRARGSSRRSRRWRRTSDRLTGLLVEAGELTWQAGPLREGRRSLPRHGRATATPS